MAPDPVQTPVPASAQLRQTRYFTWEEVAQRSGREKERWLVIDRKVYNISDFTRRHPGGSRVISHYAGQDATVSEDNRRVCTSGGMWAGREASGPRMQAPERPGLQTVAREVHTQTKDWVHVHASPLKSQAWVGSRAEIGGSELSRHPDRVACSLGLWEEESGQRVGVASFLQGWEGEHSLV